MKKLELFSSLLDDYRLVTETDFEELKHGKSIICELVQKLTQIQEKLALRRFIDGGGGDLAPIPLVEPEPEVFPQVTLEVIDRSGFWASLQDWWA